MPDLPFGPEATRYTTFYVAIFWNIALCSPHMCHSTCRILVFAGLIFYPEDGVDTLLPNVTIYQKMATFITTDVGPHILHTTSYITLQYLDVALMQPCSAGCSQLHALVQQVRHEDFACYSAYLVLTDCALSSVLGASL
jgi:hypothetical protein